MGEPAQIISNRHPGGRPPGVRNPKQRLIDEYVQAFGGPNAVSDLQMADIERAVSLTLLAAETRKRMLKGEPVVISDLTKLESTADRAVRRLGIKPGAAQPKPTLADYVARKAAQKAAGTQSGEAA